MKKFKLERDRTNWWRSSMPTKTPTSSRNRGFDVLIFMLAVRIKVQQLNNVLLVCAAKQAVGGEPALPKGQNQIHSDYCC
ncbi:hypothetical protein H6F86_02405 [Phormidium sp. FACHB-592]|uniref:Uncharacterized protein n=1 Tax=Stenomitos frigidus AS-A4 TaxID=2933935 RepID=A0ABV0KKK6_9CYAN|nr:hypothetical protein [Phormidium sp. FACHB-592]MBD2072758.1 hypothetical protein [Phormidium sp. FACHB-592]